MCTGGPWEATECGVPVELSVSGCDTSVSVDYDFVKASV